MQDANDADDAAWAVTVCWWKYDSYYEWLWQLMTDWRKCEDIVWDRQKPGGWWLEYLSKIEYMRIFKSHHIFSQNFKITEKTLKLNSASILLKLTMRWFHSSVKNVKDLISIQFRRSLLAIIQPRYSFYCGLWNWLELDFLSLKFRHLPGKIGVNLGTENGKEMENKNGKKTKNKTTEGSKWKPNWTIHLFLPKNNSWVPVAQLIHLSQLSNLSLTSMTHLTSHIWHIQ